MAFVLPSAKVAPSGYSAHLWTHKLLYIPERTVDQIYVGFPFISSLSQCDPVTG